MNGEKLDPESVKRGRPKKDPEKRKSERISIRLRPSRKKILEQEAERCAVTKTEILCQHSFQELEPHERGVPLPRLYRSLLGIAGDLQDNAEEIKTDWLGVNIGELEAKLNVKRKALEEKRERRDELRHQAVTEACTEALTIRVSPKRLRWIETRAGHEDENKSGLIRQSAFRGLRRRERMERVEVWLSKWADRARTLSDWDSQEREERIRKEMRRMAADISTRIREKLMGKRIINPDR